MISSSTEKSSLASGLRAGLSRAAAEADSAEGRVKTRREALAGGLARRTGKTSSSETARPVISSAVRIT